ncbi:cytochrome-c peroxidase [Hymenobacter monticola]|uniref:Cytochrome C peroxidase n=1 Tax=Hymenobacter monticola TaxID=1705399 RepID=A0ABY4B078_9BACT|nr:cytochrome c peroxidase [Hymenobacter monticola]UOE32370.1 cytochrome C peroxidase [Hymenobacter monticola]
MAAAVGLLLGLGSFKPEASAQQPTTAAVRQLLLRDVGALQAQSTRLVAVLQLLEKRQATLAQAQAAFRATKSAYKRTEYLTEYLDPELAKRINGAPLPKVVVTEADYLALGRRDPQFVTMPPEGLQVLEEMLFAPEAPNAAEALILAQRVEEGFNRFAANVQHQPFTNQQVLGSLREEMLRVMTMGITGFDAPAAGSEMAFAAEALAPVLAVTETFAQAGPAPEAGAATVAALQKTVTYLRQHPDFDSFDRVYFLREVANPAYGRLVALAAAVLPPADAEDLLARPVNEQATNLFDPNFLRPAYYAKQDRREPSPAQIELGRLLFFDPVLSSNNQRACASCHHPAKAFSDGVAKSPAFAPNATVARNAPTLLNAIFSTAYFWDGRAGFLENQIPEVVNRPEELHSSYAEIVQKLQGSRAYQQLFQQAFGTKGTPALSASTLNRALAAYLRSLVALNSPFDKYMRHETDALSASAVRGANLFMGKAACATCHFAPLFNGTVPPRFTDSETEVIGVPAGADLAHAHSDPDAGRGGIIAAEAWHGAFKTPTVRNAALTAPYMHNGVFGTLAEVVEFYSRGGGAGLGLPVPNQTLPFDNLDLTVQEKADLVAFMETLTDTTTSLAAPRHLPAFPASAHLNDRQIGGKY